MQCLNRRRRYLNSGRNIFWYDYVTIRSSPSYSGYGRGSLSGLSLGDAAIFAGGGSSGVYYYSSNYVDYINKNLVRSSLTNLNTARLHMGAALVNTTSTPTPAQNFDCEFISINLSSLPSGGYAYATIDNSSTQYTSGSITVSISSTVHIYMNRKSGNAGVYLYRNKGEPIVDPNSMAGGDTSMPDYHQWGSSLTYDWTPSSAPMSFTSATITFENENSGYLNCTILVESDSSSEDDTPVVTGKRAFFIGGNTLSSSGENTSTTIDIYPFGTGTHTTSNLSSPRTTFGCTVLDNKIFIAGGRNTIVGNNDSSDYYNKDLIIYNNNGQSIYTLNNALSEKKYRLTAVSSEDYAMFAGGTLYSNYQYGQTTNTIDVFNKNGIKVSTSISLDYISAPRYGPSSIYYKNNFMISTINGMNVFNSNLQKITPTGHPNRDLNIPCLFGKYALFGGGIESSDPTSQYASYTAYNDVLAYNPDLVLLRLNGRLGSSRYDGAAAVISKKYALFSGGPYAYSNNCYLDVFRLDKKSELYVRIIDPGTTSTSQTTYGAYVCKETDRTYSFTSSNMTVSSYSLDQEVWEENYLQSGSHYFKYSTGNNKWYKVLRYNDSPGATGSIVIDNLESLGIHLVCSNLVYNSSFTITVTATISSTKYIGIQKLLTEPGIFHIYAKTGRYSTGSNTWYISVGVEIDGVISSATSGSSYTSYVNIGAFKVNEKYANVYLINGTATGGDGTVYAEVHTFPIANMFESNNPINPVPAGNIIKFSIFTDDGNVYFNAEINMTWDTFISSSYNINNVFSRSGSTRIRYNGSYVYDDYDKTDRALTTETIVANKRYYI